METKNSKISLCNCTGHRCGVWVGLSYAIFGAILCDNDCINRFVTKRLYWILVWSIGIVELISSGSSGVDFQWIHDVCFSAETVFWIGNRFDAVVNSEAAALTEIVLKPPETSTVLSMSIWGNFYKDNRIQSWASYWRVYDDPLFNEFRLARYRL
jgi:hypothetical protein